MNREEERELSALLSHLLGSIHRLTPGQTHIVMEVDERMRSEALTHEDLEALRLVAQASAGQKSGPD